MRRSLTLAPGSAAALGLAAVLSLLAACSRSEGAADSGASEGAASAAGETAAPAGEAPLPPASAAAGFLQRTAIVDQFEIESAELVLQRTQNADVRRFAQRMIDDHGRIRQETQALAAAQHLSGPPARLDSPRQGMINALRDARLEDFDRRYIQQQVEAHENALQLLREFADTGDSPALKDWARRTAPAIENHLQMAKALERGPADGAAAGVAQRP